MPEADAEGDTPWAVGPLATIECMRLNSAFGFSGKRLIYWYLSRLPFAPAPTPITNLFYVQDANLLIRPRNRCVWRRVRRGGRWVWHRHLWTGRAYSRGHEIESCHRVQSHHLLGARAPCLSKSEAISYKQQSL